jgi:DNA-binding NtrC family response regulator
MKAPTVLLILDEPQDLEIYGTWLRSCGYRILMCSSLAEGINFLEGKDISLVIVSQGTSAFEGRPVLERALQLHPKVPALVVARVLDMRCYFEAMDLGAIDYLERPAPLDMVWVVDTQMRRMGAA